MNIYVSHSRNYDYQKELYSILKDSELSTHHSFIFPHEGGNGVDAKATFLAKKCDLVLAEVSFPATGQGIELGWADMLHVPVVCVYRTGSNISDSLKRVSQNFIEYSHPGDLISKLEIYINAKS